jgi:uncharacterized protein YjiS (DUF1127 family)
MTASSRAQAGAPALFTSLASGLGSLLKPIIRRRTLAKLDELDDRLLKDIGLTRFDIDAMRRHW